MRIDQVMLGRMLGDEAVGVFSAAVTISEAWYFIPVAFMTAIAPALTAAFQKSEADFERQLLASMRILLWVSIVAAVVLSLSAPSLIALLYGGQYLGAAPVLAMHAWAGVFVALGVASGPWFVNHGMLKAGMYQAVAGALVNVGLNLWLIPQFGPQGAAASTVVSYATSVILFNLFNARTLPLVRLQLRSIF
jgi:PST family polysaccharide transporter